MKFLTMITLTLFIGITTTSCSGDDGDTGPQGIDGTDGQDGNANVQTFIFNNPSWSSNRMEISLTALTTDVLDNDVVLGFWLDDIDEYWRGTNENYFDGYLRDFAYENRFDIKAFNNDSSFDATPPTVLKVKIIIIESNNTTTTTGNGKSSLTPKQQIYNELANAGVDVNDYYAVMDYYGLEY